MARPPPALLGWSRGFPSQGGRRLCIMKGMHRKGTRELGGWKPAAVVEKVRNNVRADEAAPEVKAVFPRASTRLPA